MNTSKGNLASILILVMLLVIGCGSTKNEEVRVDVSSSNLSNPEELKAPITTTSAAFMNVNIITMLNEEILVNYTVLIKEGFITEIGETDSVAIPEGAQVIEGSGHYLMPGLVDMHVHIGSFRHEEPLYLANGVTSVMNMWGRPDILATRDINNKRNLGLRLFTTGPLMDGPNPIWNNSMVLATTEEVSAAVKKVKEQGYDAVKVYELLSLDVYREIMKVAQEIDIKVMGHVPRAVGLKEVLQQKQSSIEHLSGYTELELEEMVEMTALYHVWNTPTLAIDHILQDEGDIKGSEFVHPDTLKGWQRMKAVANYKNSIESLGNRQNLVQTIHLKGGRLLAGTDANNPFVVPGFSLHSELEYLAGAGLRPYEVLKTATFNPADFLGELDKMGTVEVGKYADLILLSENPLVDIRNTQSIRGTMIRGVWKDSQALNEELQKLKENF